MINENNIEWPEIMTVPDYSLLVDNELVPVVGLPPPSGKIINMPYIPFTIGTISNGKFTVSDELRKYLEWRCVRNWHKKYYKYVNTWIENVLPYQCDYFVCEMFHLIDQGIYKQN